MVTEEEEDGRRGPFVGGTSPMEIGGSTSGELWLLLELLPLSFGVLPVERLRLAKEESEEEEEAEDGSLRS